MAATPEGQAAGSSNCRSESQGRKVLLICVFPRGGVYHHNPSTASSSFLRPAAGGVGPTGAVCPGHRLVRELLATKWDLAPPRQLRRLDNYDLLLLDNLGNLLQGDEQSEALLTLIAERYERRSLGITSNLVFSQWERIFTNPRDTAVAIDRMVHHSFFVEFDAPGYRTGGHSGEVKNRRRTGKNNLLQPEQ